MWYCSLSGQCINFAKSDLFCTPNIPPNIQQFLADNLQVNLVLMPSKYLGTEFKLRGRRVRDFQDLIDKMQAKLQGWKARILSQAGRSTLIAFVLQSMPLYTFQCFKVPEAVCNKLDATVRDFWWGHDLGTRKLHLIGWDKICQPRSNGGLGFRKFSTLNQAMLTKQFWRIQNSPDSLLAKTFKAKYFPRTHLQGYIPKPSHSWIWKNIAKPQHAELGKGRWSVGSGHQIPLNHPDWFHTPDHILRDHNLLGGTVANLIHPNTKTWKWDLLRRLYDHNTCVEISKIPIAKTDRVLDTLLWKHSNSGNYSVAKAYSLIQHSSNADHINDDIPRSVWKSLWKVKLPLKIITFVWKVMNDIGKSDQKGHSNNQQMLTM